MNIITRIATTALLTMASVAAFAQSSGEIAARDQANMHAGDNYPVIIYHSTQTRSAVTAELVKAQQDGLVANGDNYPILPQKNSAKSRADVVAAMTIAQHDAAASLYSGA
jgi:hypothetical protein